MRARRNRPPPPRRRAVGGHGHHDSGRHPAQVAGSLADAPETGLGCVLAPSPENRLGEAGAAGPGPISASGPPRSPPQCQPSQPSRRGSSVAAPGAAGRWPKRRDQPKDRPQDHAREARAALWSERRPTLKSNAGSPDAVRGASQIASMSCSAQNEKPRGDAGASYFLMLTGLELVAQSRPRHTHIGIAPRIARREPRG
jgi:hypothetical protein